MCKKILVLFIYLTLLLCCWQNSSKAQEEKIINLISVTDSLIENNYSKMRVFTLTEDFEIPNEVFDLENWAENIIETYNIHFDSENTPIKFVVFPYSKSGDWSLSHSYYFDSSGVTKYYHFYFGFFNSQCTDVLRRYVEIFFNDNFEIIKETEQYKDRDGNVLDDISDCWLLYDDEVEYQGNNNYEKIIKKYKIKL